MKIEPSEQAYSYELVAERKDKGRPQYDEARALFCGMCHAAGGKKKKELAWVYKQLTEFNLQKIMHIIKEEKAQEEEFDCLDVYLALDESEQKSTVTRLTAVINDFLKPYTGDGLAVTDINNQKERNISNA